MNFKKFIFKIYSIINSIYNRDKFFISLIIHLVIYITTRIQINRLNNFLFNLAFIARNQFNFPRITSLLKLASSLSSRLR